MKKLLRHILLCLVITPLCTLTSFGQAAKFYTDQQEAIAKTNNLGTHYDHYRLIRQDIAAIQLYTRTAAAQHRGSAPANHTITIPLPDGRDLLFALQPVQTLSNELAAANPQIQTFTGTTADGTYTLRLTLSPMGMMGTVRGEEGTIYISPLSNTKPDVLIIYNAKDVRIPAGSIKCGVNETDVTEPAENGRANKGLSVSGDCQLRTYDFAVAATGEYTTWAGSQANALVQITNTINNINAIYERDLTVHFNVVSPISIRYANAGTDPYTTSVGAPSSTTLNENQAALDLNVGTGSYDLGMVFNNDWSGGLASKPGTCNASNKGRGAAGILQSAGFPAGPSGSIFDNTVAHEAAHLMNADHSFAANNSGCGGGNVSPTTGWEPGGGSTLMAYAGVCTGNSYQNYTDNYFHGGSIAQMATYITTGAGNACASITASGNSAPTVSVPAASYNIPNSTPFSLSAPAADADASDVLSYNWEQLDPVGGTGTASSPSGTATSGPQFRSYPAVTSSTRYFPSLDVIAGTASGTYEVLPTVARTMNFRVTVRDNHSTAGCNAFSNVAVNTQSCGPFSITNFTTGTSLTANGTNTTTLTWNTASACVTCNNINILFSKDGGKTFPYTVLANTANDGTETFKVPNLATCNGRFMIKCASNIFFNVNSAAVTISSSCLANGTSFSPATDFTVPNAGNAALNLSETPAFGTQYSSPLTGTLTSGDAAGSLSFTNNGSCAVGGNAINYDALTIYPTVSGTYTFNFPTGGGNNPFGLVVNLYSDTYVPSAPCTNFIASSGSASGGPVTLASTVSASLCAQQKYVLLVSSFSSGTPALPASYSIAVVPPGAGALFNDQPNAAGNNYCYVMVRNSTNNVVAINSSADLSNSTTYPAGLYTIYGISSTSTCAALNTTFAGGSFTALNSAVLDQTSGVCAQMSANYRRVGIASTIPLPLRLLDFNARLTNKFNAEVYWSVAGESGMNDYTVERSTDGRTFMPLGSLSARNQPTAVPDAYSYNDAALPTDVAIIYYRLRIAPFSGKAEYSAVVPVRLSNGGNGIELYPNPVHNGDISADIYTNQPGNGLLNVTDLAGRTILTQSVILTQGKNTIRIPVNALASGMYLLHTAWDGTTNTLKFVKE